MLQTRTSHTKAVENMCILVLMENAANIIPVASAYRRVLCNSWFHPGPSCRTASSSQCAFKSLYFQTLL